MVASGCLTRVYRVVCAWWGWNLITWCASASATCSRKLALRSNTLSPADVKRVNTQLTTLAQRPIVAIVDTARDGGEHLNAMAEAFTMLQTAIRAVSRSRTHNLWQVRGLTLWLCTGRCGDTGTRRSCHSPRTSGARSGAIIRCGATVVWVCKYAQVCARLMACGCNDVGVTGCTIQGMVRCATSLAGGCPWLVRLVVWWTSQRLTICPTPGPDE